ncbi:Nardilysin [Harpegnathos saltator]|uniref:Nardilysin n=1 Tax=Harpegnathos saltator TaxID=610380 RepID=E2C9D7_HARSA|nr:Nardilysin [Harpegnathos saltator]
MSVSNGRRISWLRVGYILLRSFQLMMEEPMFHQLRTKEQLGYDIHCKDKNTNGILGFYIRAFIRATKYTTEYVDERIEEFLKSFAETLEKTTQEELDTFKETLKKRKHSVDVHLKQEVDRNWNEIETEYYVFDRYHRELNALQHIGVDTLRAWYAQHVQNGPNFRKLSIHVVGKANIPDSHVSPEPEERGSMEFTSES